MKLGLADIDRAAAKPLRLAEKVDADRHGRPASLAVITGWACADRRSDGVGVIPLGGLGP